MKKLLYILTLFPALAFGQTYNVAITNSLLGPVNLSFTNTTVSANAATVTGTVINASITNEYNQTLNITNVNNIGGTTVNNTNTFISYITNDIDVAGVVITNIIQNIVQSNNYYTTSGVSSVSFTGAVDGAITFAAGNNISISQTNRTFNFSSTASGGGGLSHWSATNGSITQQGAFLYPTSQVPAFSSTSMGLFIATNGAISVNIPDGGINGGSARGEGAIDLQPSVAGASTPRSSASQSATAKRGVLIGTYRSTAGGTEGNVVIGGAAGAAGTISSGEGNTIIGGQMGSITAGNNNTLLGNQSSANISAGSGSIIAATENTSIAASGVRNASIANYDGDLFGTLYAAGIFAAETVSISATNSSFSTVSAIIASDASRLISVAGTDRLRNSVLLSATSSTNAGRGSVVSGYYVTSTNDGNFVFRSWDGDTASRFTVGVSNVAAFKVKGFGINTNNPQESLHVSGRIQLDGLKIYASSTNLFITDGSTFTNRIDVVPN